MKTLKHFIKTNKNYLIWKISRLIYGTLIMPRIYFHRHDVKQTSTLYLNGSAYLSFIISNHFKAVWNKTETENTERKKNIGEIHPSLEINQISETLISRNRFVGNRRFDMLSNIYILSHETSWFLCEPIYVLSSYSNSFRMKISNFYFWRTLFWKIIRENITVLSIFPCQPEKLEFPVCFSGHRVRTGNLKAIKVKGTL